VVSVSTKKTAKPVVFVQWHGRGERDEAAQVQRDLEGFAVKNKLAIPSFTKALVQEGTAKVFLEKLRSEVGCNAEAQVMYLAAHGNQDGLSWSVSGKPLATYAKVGKALAALPQDSSLVMGACKALSAGSSLIEHVPVTVAAVYGFAAAPKSSEVAALMAGLLASDMELLAAISSSKERALSALGDADFDARMEAMNNAIVEAVDSHRENVTRFLPKGCVVRRAKRQAPWVFESFTA
jgi:hypothetical protein